MVRGLNIFRQRFEKFSDNYIIIGGAACDAVLSDSGLTPRATKDFDIILNVEALTTEFVAHFWDFIREGNYQKREQETQKRNAFRFQNPTEITFPTQIELFCRKPDVLILPDDIHITPIPADEGLSSLSAILLDDNYYNFTLKHSEISEGVHYANIEALICLKAYAYLSNKQLKGNGIHVDSVNIEKHKNDIFRLLPLLSANTEIELPDTILSDMRKFAHTIADNLPTEQMLTQAGYENLAPKDVYNDLLSRFKL
ncbi:MAG: hypothetical protein IKQ70_09905 [Bacteroidales bacterium]|nr:hypothetical protein [Bacteroidales bacterium]